MADSRFPYSSAEFKRVRAIQFGILSPDELVRASLRRGMRTRH